MNNQNKKRKKIKKRINIKGTHEIPRLCVYKSNTAVYAQIIDDTKGVTLVADSTRNIKDDNMKPIEKSRKLGEIIAKEAMDKGIKSVVFDRSGYLYHGKISALANGARKVGLEF